MSGRSPAALLCITPAPAVDRTAHVARIVTDEVLRPIELHALPGGKGVNAARAGARTGVKISHNIRELWGGGLTEAAPAHICTACAPLEDGLFDQRTECHRRAWV